MTEAKLKKRQRKRKKTNYSSVKDQIKVEKNTEGKPDQIG